ncbi:hypothetical protein [Streptomyces sp. NPDC057253]|uniref:hypothetical protein n=1 Tax=Streptomyces sp. NPDC057253 TaxID=3346069 RepID=UPI0036292F89
MKALVPSGGAGIRSRPSMPTSADPSLSVADKAVSRTVGPSRREEPTITRARPDEPTITRGSPPAPRALPHLLDADVHADVRRTAIADHGKVRIGS